MIWLLRQLHILHFWGKWHSFRSGNIVNKRGEKIGYYIYQKRECLKCGKIQTKKEDLF